MKSNMEPSAYSSSPIKTKYSILKKELKKKRNYKAARIIVRNIPFNSTEQNIQNHFSQYGKIEEVSLLRKQNKVVGCCFIQFDKKTSAAKAISHTSGKLFKGRIIIVDWAVPKDKFVVKIKEENEIKEESIEEESVEEANFVESDMDTVDRNDDTLGDGKEIFCNKSQEIRRFKKEDDLSDGRTLFFKNVPFTLSNAEFKQSLRQFGTVIYAVICIDPLTEHPKGTAFAKFEEKESADACLSAGSNLTIKGAVLQPHVALPRNSMQSLIEKNKSSKDSRNLYLVKEGVVLAGTPAASEVSKTDMSKRLELELWKTQKLKNLNMFVSPTRLIIHNLPPFVDDSKLNTIFKKYTPHKNSICETRVMRNLKDVDEKGMCTSKGYGFVSFTSHDDALHALRSVNNNPNIFSKGSRPIVSFSIENRYILKLKEQRTIKSRMKGGYSPSTKSNLSQAKKKNPSSENINVDSEKAGFAGLTANLGSKKLFSKAHLKNQERLHNEVMKRNKTSGIKNKNLKQKKRASKSTKANMKEKLIPTIKNDDDFSKMVERYKSSLNHKIDKKKWYE